MGCTILVPVLNRPQRVEPLIASLEASGADAKPLFICSPNDDEEIQTVEAIAHTGSIPLPYVVEWPPGRGDWARKINAVFRLVGAEWLLFGADDLHFHPGWLDEAMKVYEQTNACVIGTNDMHNRYVMRGTFSTHPLVHREYLECGTIDEDGKVLYEGYDHNFPDRELCETAMARRTWAFASESHVEHLHPNWNRGTDDATYQKGLAKFSEDFRLFNRRRRLWSGR